MRQNNVNFGKKILWGRTSPKIFCELGSQVREVFPPLPGTPIYLSFNPISIYPSIHLNIEAANLSKEKKFVGISLCNWNKLEETNGIPSRDPYTHHLFLFQRWNPIKSIKDQIGWRTRVIFYFTIYVPYRIQERSPWTTTFINMTLN